MNTSSTSRRVEATNGQVSRPTMGGNRLIMICLALVSLAIAWLYLTNVSSHDPWYNDVDMNIHNLVDALAINSNVVPAQVDQPGLPSKFLLALDYRVRHYLGLLPVWNLKKFGGVPDPLRELPLLIHIARFQSRGLVILFILTTAWFTYAFTRSAEAALYTIVLLSASAGLLFHGLLSRPDLLCAWFGTVVTPFCAWRATSGAAGRSSAGWLFLAGLGAGLAILAKLPGLYYLAAGGAWCGFTAILNPLRSETSPVTSRFWTIVLPVASSAALFWLMSGLVTVPIPFTLAAINRLRIAAALVGALPLLALCSSRHRLTAFLVDRGLELALLSAGTLAAVAVSYGALRTVLTESQAMIYLVRILDFVAHPDPQVKYLLSATPHPIREFMFFIRESPFLFAGTTGLLVVVILLRAVPPRFKLFISLLWVNAVVMAWLLAYRGFQDQFSLFVQVPLVLVWPLSLHALGLWRSGNSPGEAHWATPLLITASAVLLFTAVFRLEPKLRSAQTETLPPVSELTLTFLYDHDAHPARYREIMHQHYETREKFSVALAQFLANPANRP